MIKALIALPALLLFLAFGAQAANFDSIEQAKTEAPAAPATPVAAAPAAPGEPGACVDDPRLETDLVDILEAENPKIRPLITLTPETFVSLSEPVLKKLAGNALICPKTPLLKNGTTPAPVAIDFPVLWTHILRAASADDKARVKSLLAGFTSKPVAPEEVLLLTTKIPLDGAKLKTLYEAANMEPGYFPSVIDFFIKTGGRSKERAKVHVGFFPAAQREEIMENAKNSGPVLFIENVYSSYGKRGSQEALMERLHAAGLETVTK